MSDLFAPYPQPNQNITFIPPEPDQVAGLYKLRESFYRCAKSGDSGGAIQLPHINNLFLAKIGSGFEFVEKRSWRGWWLAFSNRIGMFFGGENRLDFRKNIEKIARTITLTLKQDETFFEAFIDSQKMNIEGPDNFSKAHNLRLHFHELGVILKHVKAHVEKSKLERLPIQKLHDLLGAVDITQLLNADDLSDLLPSSKKDALLKEYAITRLQEIRDISRIKIELAALKPARIFDNTAQQLMEHSINLDKAFTKILPELTRDQRKLAMDALRNTPENQELMYALPAIGGLDAASVVKAEKKILSRLWLALLKQMNVADNQQVEQIHAILSILEQKQNTDSLKTHTAGSLVNLKNMGHFFGDSFLAESGLEGSINGKEYGDLIKQFIENKMPKSKKSEALWTLFDTAIPVLGAAGTSQDLVDSVLKNLNAHGKCILYGGWADHAIVYEIEKQANGNCAFRVYNEGAGTKYHHRELPSKINAYAEKIDACVSLCDIPQERLCSLSFFSSLKHLCSWPTDGIDDVTPAQCLMNFIMPALCGKQEDVPAEVQYLVGPQHSGICTYRSLQAFLANNMSQQEFKRFTIELKLYLLDSYLPTLTKAIALPVSDKAMYDSMRLEYAVCKRSIERFSASLEALKDSYPDHIVAEAEKRVLVYGAHLSKMRLMLCQYEKQIHKKSLDLTQPQECIKASFVPPDGIVEFKEDVAAGGKSMIFSNRDRVILEKIDSLPRCTAGVVDQEFQTKWEGIICDVVDIPSGKLKMYILDSFLKKLGSFSNWEHLAISDPKSTMNALEMICGQLSYSISSTSQAADYARAASFARGFEVSYTNYCDTGDVLRPRLDAPLLDSSTIEWLGRLQCSDPFWSRHIEEMQVFSTAVARRPFKDILCSIGNEITLSEEVCKSVWDWYKHERNKELREAVGKSILDDRLEQKKLIEDQQNSCRKEIAPLEAEQKQLEEAFASASTMQEKNRIRGKINNIIDDMTRIDAHMRGIENAVQNNPDFWPWDFERKDWKCQAAFLFGRHGRDTAFGSKHSDIVPERMCGSEFDRLLSTGVQMRNMFNRTSSYAILPDFPVDMKKVSADAEAVQFNNCIIYGYENETLNFPDSYKLVLQDSPLKTVYKECLIERNIQGKDEANIPCQLSKVIASMEASEVGSDVVREIMSIVHSGEIQIDALCSYFQENGNKLSNNHWMNVFHALLFDSRILQHACYSPAQISSTATTLRRFFEKQIQNALQLDDLGTAANLAWAAQNANRYFEYAAASNPLITVKPEPIIATSTMVKVFQEAFHEKYVTCRPIVLEAALACCEGLFLKPNMNADEKQLAAIGCMARLLYVNNTPGEAYLCEPRRMQAANAIKDLQALVNSPQNTILPELMCTYGKNILQKVLPELANMSISSTDSHDQFKIVNNGNVYGSLFLTTGMLVPEQAGALKIYDKRVPASVIEILHDQRVFSERFKPNFDTFVCRIENNAVFMKDTRSPLEICVFVDLEQVFVKTIVDDNEHWLLHLKKPYELDNKALDRRYVQRCRYIENSDEFTVFLCDPITHIPVYSCQENGVITRIASNSSNENLFVVKPPEAPLLASFEDPSQTVYLADAQNALQEINFVRLGITLRQSHGKWDCMEHSGWKLAEGDTQFAPHFGPDTGFLLLEDQRGNKKVIVPMVDPIPGKIKTSLHFTYKYDFEAIQAKNSVSYAEFDLVNDTLIPKSMEARFHLARVYLESGYIDDAEALIFDHTALMTNKPLSKTAMHILEAIALKEVSKDIGARTMKARLRALHILEMNSKYFVHDIDTEARSQVKALQEENMQVKKTKLVLSYLEMLNQMPPLDPIEELSLLEPLRTQSEKIARRIEELIHGNITDVAMSEPILYESFWFGGHSNQISSLLGSDDDKAHYDELRKKGVLPFDPIAATRDDIMPYLKFLYDEIKASNWEECVQRGLPLTIFLLTQSTDEKVSKWGKELFLTLTLNARNILFRGLRVRQVHPGLAGSNPLKYPPKIRLKQDLINISDISASSDESSFLQTAKNEYLNAHAEPLLVVTARPLLDPKRSAEVTDQTVEEKFAQTAEDLGVAKLQMKHETYTLNEGMDLQQLSNRIAEKVQDAQIHLTDMKQDIVLSFSAAMQQDPISQFQFTSKKRKLPSIDELAVLCAKKNFHDELSKSYPELTHSGRCSLENAIKKYLMQKQFVQQLDRISVHLKDLKGITDLDTKQTLMNELGRSMESSRAYNLDHKHATAFLYIETILNIRMRADQIENIQKFIDGMAKGEEVVLQMIMGAGKTSVIQPILAFLFAEPGTLSVVDVPEALFETVKEGLQNVLGGAYHQHLFAMPYEREMAKDPAYLRTFLKMIEEVMARQGCFLRTPRVKQSIITSFYEAYHDQSKGIQGADTRVELIAKIVNMLEVNELVQIDEIDMAMNSKVVFKYPVGSSKVVDTRQAALLSNMLLDIADDVNLLSSVSMDFVDKYRKRQSGAELVAGAASLTPALYKEKVHHKLVEIARVHLSREIDGFDAKYQDNREYLDAFLSQSTPFDNACAQAPGFSEELKQIQAKQLAYMKEVNDYIAKTFTKPQDRELLGVAADAIKNIFPNSLLKECGSSYGADPKADRFVARPYEAPNAPKKSVYANPFEQVVYTTQMVLYYGIPKTAAIRMLESLQNEAKYEINSGIALAESQAYKRFQKLLGINSAGQFHFLETPVSERLIDAFHAAASRDRDFIGQYLKSYVYPQVRVYEKNIICTPQTYAGSSKAAFGYTGTLHTGILPKGAKAVAEIGTDGKTILAVQSKMEQKIAETRVFSGRDRTLADQMIDVVANDPDMYVFIDSGGWLKEEKTQEYARRLLAQCQAKGRSIENIVYHNEQGQIVSLEPEAAHTKNLVEVPLARSKYRTADGKSITVIAQRYETGTNIPQKSNAKAYMSIRKGMTKRDGLQSSFRMRKILLGQSVSFGVSVDVNGSIASGIFNGLMTRESFKKLFANNEMLSAENIWKAGHDLKLDDALCHALVAAHARFLQTGAAVSTSKEITSLFAECFAHVFRPDSGDVWRYMTVNEAIMEQGKNLDAAKQKMREVIEKPLRQLLCDSKLSASVRKEAFQSLEGLLVQDLDSSYFKKMTAVGLVVDAKTWIAQEVQKSLEIVKNLSGAVRNEYMNRAKAIGCKEGVTGDTPEDILRKQLEGCARVQDMPSSIETVTHGVDQELEQETEQEVEQETEIEVEQIPGNPQVKSYEPIAGCGWSPENGYKPQSLISGKFGEVAAILKRGVSLDTTLQYTQNMILNNFRLGSADHSTYFLPGRFLLCLRNAQNQTRYVMVSTQDAAYIKTGILAQQEHIMPPGEVTLIGYDGNPVISSSISPLQHIDQKMLRRTLALAKLCAGKTNFAQDELQHLKDIIGNDKEKAQKVQDMVEMQLKYLPSAVREYSGSPLQKFFEKCQAA